MIGLGSNRLSVCRRGGMSVTQAGRGGMEWLAGGRGPSWASPYSAQATAALKDAFTAAQWPTIRDYGFAHPEIVPYVNQDYWLVCSFGIEGLPWRGLNGNGNAYVDFNQQYINTGLPIDLKTEVIRNNITKNQWIFGNYVVQGSGAKCFEFAVLTSKIAIWASPNDRTRDYSTNGLVKLHYRLENGTGRTIGINGDDVTYQDTQTTIFNEPGNYITFNGCLRESVGLPDVPIGHSEIIMGSTYKDMYPFKDKITGNMEWLNILTGEYEHRVGSFTEVFYLPDGTPWTPAS